ncbi:MAG: AI-2E family transporter [Pseudomonadota bacterium]
MADSPQERIEKPGPTDFSDPIARNEVKKAAVWLGMAALLALIVILASPLLLIAGGLIVAIMLDGGTRLLGRVLPIARSLRLTIVLLLVTGFVGWTFYFTGSQLVQQAASLQEIVEQQIDQIGAWATSVGITATPEDLKELGSEVASRIGQFTAAVTSLFGAIASFVLMCVLGIFIAIEPKLYERGLAWMIPLERRDHFYGTLDTIGFTMRRLLAGRLLGMAVEGFGTWILLWLGGVPMAALLGLLTGLLAFLPNIGAIVSGALIILVGFSAGFETGLFAVGVYVFVQVIDGYVIVPMVAKKTVDLAPALVLGAQLLFGALFGIVGLALADPIVTIIKIALESLAGWGEAEETG